MSSPGAISAWPFNRAAVERIYAHHAASNRATSIHLPRLRALAEDCDTAIEFGVKGGASSAALLLGVRQHLTSYDLVPTSSARKLEYAAGRQWSYRLQSSLTAPVESCDLLFLDSLHTYTQLNAELLRHADVVRKYLIFHDTLTFGSIAADGETGRQAWTPMRGQSVPQAALGIRPAIDQLMMRDPTWRIMAHHLDSHGLLVLTRALVR